MRGGSVFGSMFSMGLNHGIGIASWHLIAKILVLLSVGNIASITIGISSEDWRCALYVVSALILFILAFALVWRKIRRLSFVDSVMDLNQLTCAKQDDGCEIMTVISGNLDVVARGFRERCEDVWRDGKAVALKDFRDYFLPVNKKEV